MLNNETNFAFHGKADIGSDRPRPHIALHYRHRAHDNRANTQRADSKPCFIVDETPSLTIVSTCLEQGAPVNQGGGTGNRVSSPYVPLGVLSRPGWLFRALNIRSWLSQLGPPECHNDGIRVS